MLTFDTKYQQEAAKLIAERIEGITEEMSAGTLEDFPAYKREAGRIAGLREALELMEEASTKMQER